MILEPHICRVCGVGLGPKNHVYLCRTHRKWGFNRDRAWGIFTPEQIETWLNGKGTTASFSKKDLSPITRDSPLPVVSP